MLRTLLVIGLALLFSLPAHARQSCDWPFRTSIQVQQNDFDGLTNYPVDLVLTNSNMHPLYNWSSAGQDLRIFSGDDLTALPFKINSWSAGSKSAEVRVSFPTLNKGTRTIYIYYGNTSASSVSQTVDDLPYVNGRIKFHTRSNLGVNPTSLAQAKNTFNIGNDTNTAYGCSHPANFTGVTNRNQGTGRSQNNFIAYSKTKFTVDVAGNWGVRYGADFGYGGGLYIDKVNVLEEIWNPTGDFWWAGNWNSQYVLDGSIYLTPGEHELEIIGAEGCCDGGVTVQFSRNYNGTGDYNTATWLPFTSANINIRSEACPIPSLTVSYGAHDVCYLDLALTSTSSTNQYWTTGTTQALNLSIANQDTSKTSPAGSKISFTLPTDLSYSSATGTNWTCSVNSGVVTCTYAQSISPGAQSSTLNISLTLSSSASSSSYTISPTVTGKTPDNVSNNNAITFTINALNGSGIPANCANPQPGLFVKFFDVSTLGITRIDSHNDFLNAISASNSITFLGGQTILPNVNGSGNPFSATSERYLTIFEGYIYSAVNTRARYGVDGDDAVELIFNNNVVSGRYGLNGPAGSAQDRSGWIALSTGFNPFAFYHHEHTGGDTYDAYWRYDGTNSYVIIPNSAFYHCAGNANIQLTSSVNVINDPVNGVTQPKAIPGAVLQHTVNAQNIGNISTDLNSTTLIQAIDSKSKMYVGNLSAGSPIIFNNAAGNQNSGLTYVFTSLTSTTDSLAFSTDGNNFNYTPVADADGYDTNITHFRLTLNGTFKPTYSGITPSFNFVYQVMLD